MTRATNWIGALVLLCAPVFLGACDDNGGGLNRTQFPEIEADPDQIVLPAVQVGEDTVVPIVLRNRGGAGLRITAIDFSNAIDSLEFSRTLSQGGADAGGTTLPVVLEQGDEMTIHVRYAPRDPGTDTGSLLVSSNARNEPRLNIPIVTAEARADLLVNPDRLVFSVGEAQGSETKAVTLQNIGTVPVDIVNVTLDAATAADFTLAMGADARPSLSQGDSVSFGVTYTPTGGDSDDGTLVIDTGDPDIGRILVPLRGEEPSAEIDVQPDSIVFGAVDLNTETEPRNVVIENLGTAALVVESVGFALAAPGVNEQFTLHDVPEGEFIVEPEASVIFSVTYHPAVDGRHATGITIRSNDADEGLVTVPINGRVRTPCIAVNPESVSFGRVALNQASARNQVQVINCGDLPLTLSEISLVGPGFEWAPAGGGAAADIMVPPLATVGLEVWYSNTDLAEGALAEGVLSIANNTPDTPVVDVPLSVVGGGAPTCDMLILPNRMNFGLVARGSNRTKTLRAVNRGTGACTVRGEVITPIFEIPIPGFNNVKFILTRPVGNIQVAPGQFINFDITYRPDLFIADSANYVLTFFDPFTAGGEERTTSCQLSGIGGESNIEVIPGRLAFGQVTAGECASREERVTVYNTGIVDLCISDIQLGEGCEEFVVVDRPIADENGCIRVTRAQPADVILVYQPADLGMDMCELTFVSDDMDNPNLVVPLTGEGIRDRFQTDVFEQTSGQTVDVLFVVDNSGSMGEEQAALQDNFADFVTGAAQFQNDYQLGIVTTDVMDARQSGRLREPRIMRNNPNIERQFEDAVDVGTNGAGEEHGLEAAHLALTDPLIFDTGVACMADGDCVMPDTCVGGRCGGYNRGFLRADAALEIVFVSDEDDFSTAPLNFYVDFFKSIKGFRNEGRFHAHAIVGSNNGRAASCQGANGDADPGRRYVEVASRTNGGIYSICDDDFGRPLQQIGNQAFGLPVQFFLSRPAIRATIEVTVDGARRVDGWVYDEESNSIIFDDATVPQAGQMITVRYEAQCFPRR